MRRLSKEGRVREYFANVIMIALAIVFLAHFGLIVRYEQVTIQEPNPFILYSEVAFFVAIVGFGVFNLIKLKGGR